MLTRMNALFSTALAGNWMAARMQSVKIRSSFGFALFCILLFCFPRSGVSSAAATLPAEEVLRRALQARGGYQAFSNIHSFCAKGTVSFYTSAGPWWDAPEVTN